MLGANLVLACDILSRVLIRPYELSVSLLLGIIGSLVFILLLWRGDERCSLKANIPSSSAFSLFWPSELVSSILAHHSLVSLCLEVAFPKIIVYLLVAIATGISTISFQTLTENRFPDAKYFRRSNPSTSYCKLYYWFLKASFFNLASPYLRIPSLCFCPIPLLSRLTRLLEDTDEARPGLHPADLSSPRKSLSKYQYLPSGPDGSKRIR